MPLQPSKLWEHLENPSFSSRFGSRHPHVPMVESCHPTPHRSLWLSLCPRSRNVHCRSSSGPERRVTPNPTDFMDSTCNVGINLQKIYLLNCWGILGRKDTLFLGGSCQFSKQYLRYTWGCSTFRDESFHLHRVCLTFARTFLSHLSKNNNMINFYQLFQDGQKQIRSNCTFPPPFVSLKLTKLLRQHAAKTLLHCSMTETPLTKFDAQRIEFNCFPTKKSIWKWLISWHPTPNGIFWMLFADFGDFSNWEEWCSFHLFLWKVLGFPQKPRTTFRVFPLSSNSSLHSKKWPK